LLKTLESVAEHQLLRNLTVYLTNALKLLIVALRGISEMVMMNRRGYCLWYCTYLEWTNRFFNWSNEAMLSIQIS